MVPASETGAIAPARMKGGDEQRLVRAGIDLERAQHGGVEGHRRVGVDQADHDGLAVDDVGAEENLRHLDGIGGALRVRDRAHERLVGIAHVRIDHVEMALVDGHVDRLADGAAGVVHGRRHVGELDQVLEVLELGVAAPLLDVVDEGGPVDRREDRVGAAHLHRALGIARDLGEARGRRRYQAAREPARKAHPLAVDVGAGLPEQRERFRVLAEVDPDLLEDGLRVLLDERQALLGEQPHRGDVARDVAQVLDLAAAPLRAPCGATAAAPAASSRLAFAVVRCCRHVRESAAVRARSYPTGHGAHARRRALSELRRKPASPRQGRARQQSPNTDLRRLLPFPLRTRRARGHAAGGAPTESWEAYQTNAFLPHYLSH